MKEVGGEQLLDIKYYKLTFGVDYAREKQDYSTVICPYCDAYNSIEMVKNLGGLCGKCHRKLMELYNS